MPRDERCAPSGYPALLWLIGLPVRSLAVITTLQHLAGLAVGVASYALLRQLDIGRWAATVATALIVLDAYAIALEQTVLAEAFLTLALIVSALLVVQRGHPRRGALAISGALLAAAVLMRTAALFALPVCWATCCCAIGA